METIAHGITELIGSTPMLEPVRFTRACGLQAQLFVKLEGFNPAGSAKDRIARAMIEEAEKNGQLKPGSVIIEPTLSLIHILDHENRNRQYRRLAVRYGSRAMRNYIPGADGLFS